MGSVWLSLKKLGVVALGCSLNTFVQPQGLKGLNTKKPKIVDSEKFGVERGVDLYGAGLMDYDQISRSRFTKLEVL